MAFQHAGGISRRFWEIFFSLKIDTDVERSPSFIRCFHVKNGAATALWVNEEKIKRFPEAPT